MIKNFIFTVAIGMAITAINVFGQSDPFTGWNCTSVATNGGYCTRTLAANDIGWNFAGTLFNDNRLWTRFVDDNPDKVKVFERNGKTILQWREGEEIRIRRTDLAAIANGTATMPAAPATVGVEIVAAESWWQSPWSLVYYLVGLLTLSALAILAMLALAALERFRRSSANRPADIGPGFRPTDARTMFNMPPRTREVVNHYGSTLMPGGFDVIYQVTVENGTFPTRYSDGRDRTAFANGDNLLFGVKLDEQGNIEQVVPAWQMCFNPLARLTAESAQQLLQSNPTFANPTVLHTRKGKTAPAWEAVEAFWRNTVQVVAQPATEEVAADQTAAANPVAADSLNSVVNLTEQGLMLKGRINLPDGMTLDTGDQFVSMTGLGTLQKDGTTITVSAHSITDPVHETPGGETEDKTNAANAS